MTVDARDLPLDDTSTTALAERGLVYRRMANDGAEFDVFLPAVARGFLDEEPTAEQIAESRAALVNRRLTAVTDPHAADPGAPVATIDAWASEVTVDPERVLPMWAISGVTVAPTHRRRGIAAAMLGGELRTAAAAGFPLAGLTVTEATIYGRWGFSPAVFTADWRIDTRRAAWTGPTPTGRLEFVAREQVPERIAALHERVRRAQPGAVPAYPGQWRRVAGLRPGTENALRIRAVVYRDGEVDRGVLVYALADGGDDYTAHELRIHALVADGPDAHAALWRFAIEHDLVATVTASLRPVDDPVRWMISDQRAARVSVTDHGWLRVLDVPAVLAARTYARPLSVVFAVEDPLGLATGVWRLEAGAAGAAHVAAAVGEPDVRADVGALSSALLGGVRWSALAAAGRVRADAAVLAALDAAFAAAVTPTLDIWY
ncbi:GNAT family N-acetyltransferase [Microbacterium sp. 10M-3C3]|jgi:predicted acetyltransferase|uniref:GNAT family N-acetyltransferase n=1 Tax=Microbacterium sp. 10M-3C3 TaxID=2483401 RepID=UPI000F640E24|nr:GNAT family N-acetyltransferase [Microbacterium sp. 10M-3C3]